MSDAWLENLQSDERHDLIEVNVLGRALDCSLRLDDPFASRRHAMIRKQMNSYWLYDLGSINGSYIKGRRVVTATKLCDNDVIKISESSFTFHEPNRVDDTFTSGMDRTVARVETISVIMLVSDVKGFSKISEKLEPAELAQVIGSWYKECNLMLPARGAGIDKFIGDAVLAYWMDTSEESKIQALHAAHDLQLMCHKIETQYAAIFEKYGVGLSSGVALNQGLVAHGGMEAGAFTLLGEAVNITFRLEGLTRQLETDCVVSDAFAKDWPEGEQYFESAGLHDIKGHSKQVAVHKIVNYPS